MEAGDQAWEDARAAFDATGICTVATFQGDVSYVDSFQDHWANAFRVLFNVKPKGQDSFNVVTFKGSQEPMDFIQALKLFLQAQRLL